MPKRGLSTLAQKFCYAYLVEPCGAEAARKAGYAEKGAAQRAHILLNDPLVVEEIARLNKERFNKLQKELKAEGIDSDAGLDVIRELATIAYSDITDYLETDFLDRPVFKPLDQMVNTRAVKGFKIRRNGDIDLRLWDKNAALKNLGVHYKLFGHEQDLNLNVSKQYDLTKLPTEELKKLKELLEKAE